VPNISTVESQILLKMQYHAMTFITDLLYTSPDLSTFLLDLDWNLNRKDLDSDFGRFVTKSNFSFHSA